MWYTFSLFWELDAFEFVYYFSWWIWWVYEYELEDFLSIARARSLFVLKFDLKRERDESVWCGEFYFCFCVLFIYLSLKYNLILLNVLSILLIIFINTCSMCCLCWVFPSYLQGCNFVCSLEKEKCLFRCEVKFIFSMIDYLLLFWVLWFPMIFT